MPATTGTVITHAVGLAKFTKSEPDCPKVNLARKGEVMGRAVSGTELPDLLVSQTLGNYLAYCTIVWLPACAIGVPYRVQLNIAHGV